MLKQARTFFKYSSSHKDLDNFLNPKLNFVSHINQTVSSVKRMLGLIFRKIPSNFKVHTLFDAFVRSRQGYGSLIWVPTYAVHIESIESVQRQFTKYMVFESQG